MQVPLSVLSAPSLEATILDLCSELSLLADLINFVSTDDCQGKVEVVDIGKIEQFVCSLRNELHGCIEALSI